MDQNGDRNLRRHLPSELSVLKGLGVKVAVIDSGVNNGHPHVGKVEGGISFTLADNGNVKMSEDYTDLVGHGTACAAVIRGWAPLASVLAVKILDDSLSSRTELLIEGIEWSLASGADVINMSLGTYREDLVPGLERTTQKASESGVVLIASCQNPENPPAPARLPSVISASPDFEQKSFHIRVGDNGETDFIVYPYPREAPGFDKQHNFQGPSFASAHVSGIVCLFKERRKGSNHLEVRKSLIGLSGEFSR
jgi:subtilisin family serine protease